MNRYLLPLGGFVVLTVLLVIGLQRDPHLVPSPLIGKPVPAFSATLLQDPRTSFSPAQMQDKVWILNIWAAWCVACREEHPVLLSLAGSGAVPMIGLDYKDSRPDAINNLASVGNPYALSIFDPDGKVGFDLGVYGVPESFVIDRHGIIRKKFIGPLTQQIVTDELLPLVRELNHA